MPLSDIVIIHSVDDTASAMTSALEGAGWTTFATSLEYIHQGRHNLASLLRAHDPRVIVWDLPHPYAEHWADFQTMRTLPIIQGRGFVFTTPDADALSRVAGNARAIEIAEPALSVDALCAAVRRVWDATDPR
jgi:hypothetical protein